jgi:DNA-binding response OmpR family regulator
MMRVMTIGNDTDFFEYANHYLNESGYVSLCVFESENLYEVTRKFNPNIVLLDVQSTVKSDTTLVSLKKCMISQATPLLIVIKQPMDQMNPLKYLAQGATDIVENALEPNSLLFKIRLHQPNRSNPESTSPQPSL